MLQVSISNKDANQKLNVSTDYGTLEVELRTVDGITLMSVKTNQTQLINSIKVAPNVLIMKYRYLQEQYGDFMFSTTGNEYPYYKNFNNANKLYWLNREDIEKFKNGTI